MAPARPEDDEVTRRLKDASFRIGMLTAAPHTHEGEQCPAGKALLNADGKDVVKKTSTRKGRYLINIGARMAKLTAGRLGTLAQLDTRTPVLYIDLPEGRLKFLGALVFPAAKYAVLRFGAKQVLCEDVLDAMVVFPRAVWVGRKEDNPEERELPLPPGLLDPSLSLDEAEPAGGPAKLAAAEGAPAAGKVQRERGLAAESQGTSGEPTAGAEPWEQPEEEAPAAFAAAAAAAAGTPTPGPSQRRASLRATAAKVNYADKGSESESSDSEGGEVEEVEEEEEEEEEEERGAGAAVSPKGERAGAGRAGPSGRAAGGSAQGGGSVRKRWRAADASPEVVSLSAGSDASEGEVPSDGDSGGAPALKGPASGGGKKRARSRSESPPAAAKRRRRGPAQPKKKKGKEGSDSEGAGSEESDAPSESSSSSEEVSEYDPS